MVPFRIPRSEFRIRAGDVDQRVGVATLRTWTVWVRIPPSPLERHCRRIGVRPGLISLDAGFDSLVCNSGNLTPKPPSLRGKGALKAPPRFGEGLGRGSSRRPGRPTGRAGRSRACPVWVRLPPRSLIAKRGRQRAGAVPCKHGDGVQLPATPLNGRMCGTGIAPVC